MSVTKIGDAEWQISTDEHHQIEVPSYLISSEWERSAAYCGQKVFYLIFTCFVGDGSEVTVKCKTSSGSTIGEKTEIIYQNYIRNFFVLPEEMAQDEKVFFEVASSSLGMKGLSQPIPVYPMPIVRDLKWNKDTAERGDELILSATISNIRKHTPSEFIIYEYDPNMVHESIVQIPVKIEQSDTKITWKYVQTTPISARPTRASCLKYGAFYEDPKLFFTVLIGTTEYGKQNQDSGFVRLPGEVEAPVDLLEFEDMLFNHSSAVPLPLGPKEPGRKHQHHVSGLDVLESLYRYLQEHETEKHMVIAGHTDSTGNGKYNKKLSLFRAQAIQYLLEADKDGWRSLFESQKKSGVETYQTEDIQNILNWAHKYFGMKCGPLEVNGFLDKTTQHAIKGFKADFNKYFEPSDSKKLDDTSTKIDKYFWGAIYDLYQWNLADRLIPDDQEMPEKKAFLSDDTSTPWMGEYRSYIKWVQGNKESCVIGCGESWPIEKKSDNNYRSQTNRRVEILLFDKDEANRLSLDCKGNSKCGKDDCPLYSRMGWEMWPRRAYLPVKPGGENLPQLGVVWTMLKSPLNYPICKVNCTLLCTDLFHDKQKTSVKGELFFDYVPLEPCTLKMELEDRSIEVYIPWLRSKQDQHEIVVFDVEELLGPPESVFGAQVRLIGLGYDCGEVDGVVGKRTKKALIKFQESVGLELTGKLDEATQSVLSIVFEGHRVEE